MRFTPDLPLKLADNASERVRRAHATQIAELQKTPAAGALVVSDVELEDGVATQVAHGLDHVPLWVGPSAVRGATSTGRIVQSASDSKFVTITATGHGATVTIDLLVM